MNRWLKWPWLVGYALLLLAFATWFVPQISADRYRERIHAALEDGLGRKVEIAGAVKFRLLPVPGFTIENVEIGEDPAIGPEPIAYVTTLRTRLRIAALLEGSIEFASVDLEEAYLNLTRVDRADSGGVQWNFASLMRPKLLAAFPSIHLISGRVNFKFGETKSIFYLANTDVDLWPPSRADAPWTLRVSAEPARTDRPMRGHGFGSLSVRGELHPRDRSVILDVKLEKSELGDMVTLFEGRETGLHGHVWGDAHLAGPVSRVGLAGRINIDDIHGWNQTPPGGNAWPLAVGGAFDVPGQTVDVRVTTMGKQSAIDLRYRVTDYLRKPRWAVTAIFSDLPMSPLMDVARNMGWGIPRDMSFSGTAQGVVGYSMPEGKPRMDGALRLVNSTLAVVGTPPLKIGQADLQFAGSAIVLSPASILNDTNESAILAGDADIADGAMHAALTSDGMSIASLRRQISVAAAPLVSQMTDGSWSGRLRYSNDRAETGHGPWTGELHLRDAEVPFEAFSQPLRIASADASIDGASVELRRMTVSAGGIAAQGEYRYDPSASRPHKFRLTAARASAQELEKLLMPSLHRGSFLTYAFNFGRVPEPDWMRAMHADGNLRIAAFDLGVAPVKDLSARLIWDGAEVRLSGVQGQTGDTVFKGDAAIDLSQRQPQYRIAGRVAGLPWRSGALDADGSLDTSGTGLDVLRNMSAKGSFRARNVDLAPLDTYDQIDGCFAWAWDARNPKLKLTQLVMTTGTEVFLGSAEMVDNGQLMLRASDGTKQILASGAVLRGDALKPVAQ